MKLFKQLGIASVIAASLAASSVALAQGTPAAPAPAAAPAADADSIVVVANHTERKPDDPVQVKFEKFKVTKASFDPKKIEGGKATIEIDANSLKSGADKRDAHLKTPDFIDTTKNPSIIVDIDNVKKKAEKTYSADATVKFRGITKKLPVTFDVIDTKADSIKIKGEAAFTREDFKVGKVSKDPKESPVANELTVKLQLTLKKT